MSKKSRLLTRDQFARAWQRRYDELIAQLQRLKDHQKVGEYKKIWRARVFVEGHYRSGHYANVPVKRRDR